MNTLSLRSAVFNVRLRRFYPLPDAILFLFLLCIARQYLWVLGGSAFKNGLAYALSTLIAGVVIWLFSAKRGMGWEGTDSELDPGWHLWLQPETVKGEQRYRFCADWLWFAIVVAPLFVFFFLRAPFPSLDIDNLNYHLINTQRALRGWPMIEGDFFPGTLLVNPAPDMAFGVVRALVGHRLAPVLNIAVLVWLGSLLNEIFALFIKRKAVRYIAVLFAIGTDHVLYLVNLYMVDLLSLPLLLSALLLTIRFSRAANKANALMRIALWLGIAVAFKLTNLCFALPILLLLLFELWRAYKAGEHFPRVKHFTAAIIIGALPSLFFFGYMYYQTGNPVFPYLNNVFHSDMMLPLGYRDLAHGPENLWQAVLWPVLSFIYPERLSAMSAPLYTGRVNIGFVLACALLVGRTASPTIKKICVVILTSSFMWSLLSGDIRYALLNEALAGVLCVLMLAHVLTLARSPALPGERFKTYLAFGLYASLLVLFSSLSIWFALIHVECFSSGKSCNRAMQPYFMTAYSETTYSLYQQVFVSNMDTSPSPTYFKEARYFLRDRNSQDFLGGEEQNRFSKVDVWLNCYDATSGVMAIVAPDKPMISVAKFLDLFDYMKAEGARQRVRAILENQRGKRMYTLLLKDRLEEARRDLARAPLGLRLGPTESVSIPMFSPFTRTDMVLVEVLQ